MKNCFHVINLRTPFSHFSLKVMIFLFLTYPISNIHSQNQSFRIKSIGNLKNEIGNHLRSLNDNQVIFSIQTDGSFDIEGLATMNQGEEDAIVVKFDLNQERIEWGVPFGSIESDEIFDVQIGPDLSVVVAGIFWEKLTFGDTTIQSGSNPRAVYIARISSEGEPMWISKIESSGINNVSSILIDQKNEIFLTGFFNHQLIIDSDTITSKGNLDGYVLKLNSIGDPLWSKILIGSDQVRPKTLTYFNNQSITISGNFNERLEVEGEVIQANSNDSDLFICQIDFSNNLRWLKKIGGVFDDFVETAVQDSTGNIYLAGSFVGTLEPAASKRLESFGGNPDFFLIKLDPQGEYKKANSFGGTFIQEPRMLKISKDSIGLVGIYTGDWTLGMETIKGSQQYIFSFYATFDLDLNPNNSFQLKSTEGNIFVNGLTYDSNQNPIILGSFEEDFYLSNREGQLVTKGGFDAFLLYSLEEATTPINLIKQNTFQPIVYPIPSREFLEIESNQAIKSIKIYDPNGVLVSSNRNSEIIRLNGLPKGVYSINIESVRGETVIRKIILN